jgi:hypothetical protein
MTEQQLAAVKQALEALKECRCDPRLKYEHPFYDKVITDLEQAIAQNALDKKAENARELGLDYGPHKGLSEHLAQATNGRVRIDPVTGNVGIGTAPVQEPEYWNVVDAAGNIVASETDAIRGWARIAGSYKPTVEGLLGFHDQGWRVLPKVTSPAPQPVPVKTYHDGKPWPVAPKPWVGLTDEEIQTAWDEVMDGAVFTRREVYKVIEAKLKEKNI